MFCSTVIPTIGRPTLASAVQSVLDQDFTAAEFEVIVVNDSGKPLPDEAWQKDRRVRVIHTNRRERSVARNTGAAIAKGKYLHFLDDDDTILPSALNSFWTLDQQSDAVWLYGSYITTDNDGKLVEEISPGITGNIFTLLVAGEGIPLQTSLLRSDIFFKIGGYDSSFNACEDRDVGRRMTLLGDIAYTPDGIAQIRIGEAGSSTNWANLAESDQRGREKALQSFGAFKRMRASAKTSYWRGRGSRAYFASMVWNLKHGSFLAAVERFFAGLALTGLNIFTPGYWNGLRTKIK